MVAAGDPRSGGAARPLAPPPTRGGTAICLLGPDAGVPRDPGAVLTGPRGMPAAEHVPRPRVHVAHPSRAGGPRGRPSGCQRADTWPVAPAGPCWTLLSPVPPSCPHSLSRVCVKNLLLLLLLSHCVCAGFFSLSICCPKLRIAQNHLSAFCGFLSKCNPVKYCAAKIWGKNRDSESCAPKLLAERTWNHSQSSQRGLKVTPWHKTV